MTDWGDTGRDGPLKGLRVLDFSRILSGPYASMVLADMGAEVIKVEALRGGDETRNFPPFAGPHSHYFVALNRSKRSIALDLKHPEGVGIARRLAQDADVVLENFRPGVMDRLGLGHEHLTADHPGLIYCSITGFGAGSPLSDSPAFDIVAQALSGVMSINREPDQPPNRLGLPLGDLGGSIFAVFGILAALHERDRTGRGKRVDVAMLDSLIAMLGYLGQIYFVSGHPPEPVGTKHSSLAPYGAYPTRDGHVIVACLTEGFWHNFARSLGRADLIADPRFSDYQTRLGNRLALDAIVEERMRQEDTAYWLDRLQAFDVPNAPILGIGEALEQPHVVARGLVERVDHPEAGPLRMVRSPIRFDNEGPAVSGAPPLLGADTEAVLRQVLGLSSDETARLAAIGAVGLGAGAPG